MTDIDTVRLLTTDLAAPPDQLFTNDQLQSFLDLNGASVRRAAAEALETISTSEVLLSKKIQTQDLSTDGPAVAAELRARAAQLRGLAADEGTGDDFGFEIIDGYTGTTQPELTERPQYWGL